MEAWSTLAELVVGAVAVVLDKLTLLAHLEGTKSLRYDVFNAQKIHFSCDSFFLSKPVPPSHRGAVLARVSPVPALCEVVLGAGVALGGGVCGAVSLHSSARRTLVTHQDIRGHGVTVLVLWRYVLLLEGPG